MNHLNPCQIAAILCGLRLLEQRLIAEPMTQTLTEEERAILTNDGELKPLTPKEVDVLRGLLNLRTTITFTKQEIKQIAETLSDGSSAAMVLACGDSDNDQDEKDLDRIAKNGSRLSDKFANIVAALKEAK